MTAQIINQLNNYTGENLTLDYDEAATALIDGGAEGKDLIIGGIHYHCEQGVWSEVGPFGTRVVYDGEIRVVGGGFDAHLGFYDCDGGQFGDDWKAGVDAALSSSMFRRVGDWNSASGHEWAHVETITR